MTQGVRLSPPYVRKGPPQRYGCDFDAPGVGFGRIEEAPPRDKPADANSVSRVIVRFDDREDLLDIDTAEVPGAPADLYTFRRQIIHRDVMATTVSLCVDAALTQAEAEQS